MLQGLDAINWHNLEHAYGPAGDVPGLLRDLASRDEQTRESAHYELYGNLYHQGTIYEPTAFAVPFLLRLVADESVPDRSWILAYLANLARGTSFINVHQHLPEIFPNLAPGSRTPEVEAQLAQELQWVEDVHSAVRKGLPLYLRLLDHSDATIRSAATFPLARFKEDASSTMPALGRRLSVETVPDVRVRIILGLAALQSDTAARIALYVGAFENEPSRRTKLLLALAALDDLGDDAPQGAVAYIVEALPHVLKAHLAKEAALKQMQGGARPIPQLQRIDMLGDEDGDETGEPSTQVLEFARELMIFNGLASLYPNLYHVSETLRNVEYRRLQPAIPALIAALKAYGGAPEAIFSIWSSVVQTLVYAAFGVKPELEAEPSVSRPRRQELTADQRATLRAIADSEVLWRFSGNAQSLLEPLGVPYERAQLRALLSS
ncbi:MAG TPA: hypothetical protein VGP82_12530 [Ktedonobacterales bacterium]|nr:hypothetical protein [Ktedonobacterales bacterium]